MKDLLKNIFATKDEKELAASMKEAEKALDMTGDIARKCLGHEDFRTYREAYERTERITVDSLILYTKNFAEADKGDMQKYALTCMRLLTKLQDLRYLVRSIETDSKKGLSDEKPKD